MKLKDLSTWEKDAILDKEGNVLCPVCQKELAIVTEYGMIRNCGGCKNKPSDFNLMVSFVSHDYREADGKEATKGLYSKDAHERKLARETLAKIRNETSRVRSMRRELVKAHREGDQDRIKDIHEDVKNKKDYK